MRNSDPQARYTLLSVPSIDLDPPPSAERNQGLAQDRFEWEATTPDARHVVFNRIAGSWRTQPQMARTA